MVGLWGEALYGMQTQNHLEKAQGAWEHNEGSEVNAAINMTSGTK